MQYINDLHSLERKQEISACVDLTECVEWHSTLLQYCSLNTAGPIPGQIFRIAKKYLYAKFV